MTSVLHPAVSQTTLCHGQKHRAAVALQLFLVPSSTCAQACLTKVHSACLTKNHSECIHACPRPIAEAKMWCLAMQVGFVKASSLLVLYGLFVVLVLAADIHHRIR